MPAADTIRNTSAQASSTTAIPIPITSAAPTGDTAADAPIGTGSALARTLIGESSTKARRTDWELADVPD